MPRPRKRPVWRVDLREHGSLEREADSVAVVDGHIVGMDGETVVWAIAPGVWAAFGKQSG